jgi:formate C-acetyltransferase
MEMAIDRTKINLSIQKGLERIEERRFQSEAIWTEKLTVLDEETVKLPLIKRKALAIKKLLSEMPIEIMKHELIAGAGIPGARGYGQGCFPEYATREEIEAAAKKFAGPRSVFGHSSPHYPRYLKLGISGLKKLAEEKLSALRRNGRNPGKEAWYEGVIISLDGFANFIRRHRDIALELADSETDSARKIELSEIAKISQQLLLRPPQSFREAIQAVWYVHIAFRNTMNYLPLGRFDQYLWPFLKKDIDTSAITIDGAQELIDCFWVKCNDQLQKFELQHSFTVTKRTESITRTDLADRIGFRGLYLGGRTTVDRMTTGGYADGGSVEQFLQTITLSGLTPEGSDGTNLLTYLCLNTLYRLKTPQPCLYVRFHDASPPELLERTADCIRAGCIGPTVYNDEVIIPALMKLGIPEIHARDYTSDGCWEPHIQGRTYFKHGWVSAAEALDRMISPESWEGVKPPLYIEDLDPFAGSPAPNPYNLSSFDEIIDQVKENVDKIVGGFISVAQQMRDDRVYSIAPLPLLSAFVEGPLESGMDITQSGAIYTFHMPELAGLSHAADSLAVIRKFCFEENRIQWSKLLDAVRSNWQDNEFLRQLVRTRAPAYGNDEEYVDDIAVEIVDSFVQSVTKHSVGVPNNVKYPAGLATFEVYAMLGAIVGATPDGRFKGEPLSTNASPSIGRAANGQTAAINSFMKLPLMDLPGGACLDLNICDRANLLLQLEAFIKSFVEKRGSLVNIAVNDCEKLRAAQKEPEKYRDLKVRVGGYEAYFVDLPPEHQELQIQRCEQYA